jgi:peptidoglycan/LPS O-acetylase OafA/YrhL
VRQRHRGGEPGPGPAAVNDPAHRVELAPQFPVLDTLRAVGAFAVLTTHAMFWSGDYLGNGWLGTLWARLDVGVSLFFVLSGFLLSRPWFARRELDLPAPATGRYLWKRFLRIYPAYAVVAVISLGLLSANSTASVTDWVATLALADIYVDDHLPAGLTQMWSLATEVAFYLVLPLLMWVLLGRPGGCWRPWRVWMALLLGCVVSVWWLLDGAWRWNLQEEAMPLQWLPSYIPWFAAGMGLAMIHVLSARPRVTGTTQAALRVARSLAAAPGACWVAACGVLLVTATPIAGPALLASPTPGELVAKVALYTLFSVLLVTPAIFGDPGSRYARLMSLPLARHLGFTSYSLFCVHLPVLHFVMWYFDFTLFAGDGLQIWLLTVVLSGIAAEMLYRIVERPAQRLRGKTRPGAVQESAPTTASTTR